MANDIEKMDIDTSGKKSLLNHIVLKLLRGIIIFIFCSWHLNSNLIYYSKTNGYAVAFLWVLAFAIAYFDYLLFRNKSKRFKKYCYIGGAIGLVYNGIVHTLRVIQFFEHINEGVSIIVSFPLFIIYQLWSSCINPLLSLFDLCPRFSNSLYVASFLTGAVIGLLLYGFKLFSENGKDKDEGIIEV